MKQLLLLFFFFAFGLGLFLKASRISPQEIAQFASLIEASQKKTNEEKFAILQHRKECSREIVTIDPNHSSGLFLANDSLISLEKCSEYLVLNEEVTDFKGCIQEQGEEKQKIRFISAATAWVDPLNRIIRGKDVTSYILNSTGKALADKESLLNCPAEPNEVYFKANEMEYDEYSITLSNGILLKHPIGNLSAHRGRIEKLQHGFASTTFQSIHIEEQVRVQPLSGEQIYCHSLDVNPQNHSCRLEGAPQIKFKKEDWVIFANSGLLQFQTSGNAWELQQVHLYDQIQWRDLAGKKFALADQISYDPKNEEIRMIAKEGNRVLFVDLEQQFHLSCKEAVSQTDEKGQRQVTGKGAVRFIFNAEEWEQVKRNIYEQTPDFIKS